MFVVSSVFLVIPNRLTPNKTRESKQDGGEHYALNVAACSCESDYAGNE